MPGIQPVKGTRLRATKINSCGKPIAGSRNRLVTSGYVSLNLTPVMQAAQDLTQLNAEGRMCFEDRTPPERRWYTPALELCNVNTGLLTMFTGWETLVDELAAAIGFRDDKLIESDYGIALELWTAGRSEDDCASIPTTDATLSDTSTGRSYGYFLFGGTEWAPGDIKISGAVSTFTLTGRTIALPYWGHGPYNVQLNSAGAARRLITAMNRTQHLTAFRTAVPPPDPTAGTEPVALALSTLFTGSNYYYGGPSNAAPIAIAPEQGSSESWTLTTSGVPTGGTFTLLVDGVATAAIAYNATAAAIKTALVAVDDGYTAADFTTGGGALPTLVTIATDIDVDIEVGTNSLTGGSTPAVVLTAT